VALVEVDPVDDALDRLVEGRVVEDDVRGLPAELERQLHPAPGELPLNELPDLGRAGEREFVDALVPHQVRAGRAVARDDVDHPRWQLGLAADVREEHRGERRRLGRLQDDGVPAGERRRDLPGEHEERKVPRDDLRSDAEGLRRALREGVLELVRPARVVEEVRGRKGEIDVARLPDRLASVERLGDCELARALLEDARDAEEVFRALRRRDVGPAVLERATGRPDRELDVLLACLCHFEELLFARGRDRREPLARPWLDLLAADEEPVALADLDDVARFGRRCVLPLERSGRGHGSLLDLGHGVQSIVK
jgi:hypothetical protein